MTSTGLLRRRGTDPSPPLPSSPTTFPDHDDPAGETRDWAALPRDVLLDVFLRLGSSREIMRGAELACAPWRRVAVDEPALWRRVDMATVRLWSPGWREMVRAAVDRSAGQCAAFAGPADDDSLRYLVERHPSYLHSCCTCCLEQVLAGAPCLKCLHLLDISASREVLNEAIKALTFLEDLEISPYFTTMKFESVCQACPRLKSLKLRLHHMPFCYSWYKVTLPMMWELRSIKLHCEITVNGLKKILDSCPVLESLHITGTLTGSQMDDDVRGKLARVRNLTLPYYDPVQDYDYDPSDFYWWH